MKRRTFLASLLALPAAAKAAVWGAPKAPRLMFHPDAFKMVAMELPRPQAWVRIIHPDGTVEAFPLSAAHIALNPPIL